MFILWSDASQVALLQAVTQGPRLLPFHSSVILWLSGYILASVHQWPQKRKNERLCIQFLNSSTPEGQIASTYIPLVRTAHKIHLYARRDGEYCSCLASTFHQPLFTVKGEHERSWGRGEVQLTIYVTRFNRKGGAINNMFNKLI